MAESDDRARLEARLGKTLRGKWKLERLIGIGGMAAVYAASHRNGAEGAIKILHAEFARRADARNRFLREAYIANKVGRGAVRVVDDDVDDDGAPFLVMDLLHGEPVDVRAKRLGGKLPLPEVVWIAEEVLTTLEHAHEQGIIHRDLKPDNLFWTTQKTLKVLDFGVARLRDSSNTTENTRTGTVMGTPMFMAPEQALGSTSEIDGRSDLWSLGAIMFRLITGRHVHAEAAINALVIAATKRAPPITSVDETVPAPIAEVIDTALQFESDKRYPNATAMLAALREAAARAPAKKAKTLEMPVVDSLPPPPASSEEGDAGLATGMSHDDTVALHKILRLVEEALVARKEDGAGAPTTIKKVDEAYRQATTSLGTAHIGLFWNVVPEGFVAREQFVWVPKAASRAVPAALANGGVRMIGLLPGVSKPEFTELLRMMSGDLAPFTDYATFLHSRQLEHVVHRIDPTQPGMPEHKSISVEPSTAAGLEVILETLKESDDTALRVTLLSRLERFGEGHEAELGKLLETAGVEVAMGLLRVLDVIGTPAAKEAVDRAIKNPNAIVRIVALAHVGATLRRDGELGALLNGPDPQARFDALVTIEKYQIGAALGAIVTRIGAPAFDKLPIEERRQAFSALGALDARRAESLAVEILGKPRDAATHQVAIELLGSVGESPEGRLALESAADGESATGRALAVIALASFEARTSVGP